MIFKIPHELALCCGIDAGHRVSGHLFEQIEYFYYFYFMKHVDVCIVSDDADVYIDQALEKYNFTPEETQIIKSRIYKYPKNIRILAGNKLLFVDGATFYMHNTMIKGEVYYFRCSWENFQKHSTVFQDTRMYKELPNSVHYVKKILFEKLKKPEVSEDNKLLYLTKNCRHLSEAEFNEVLRKYEDGRKFLVISDKYEPYYNVPEVIYEEVPVENLFSRFSTYIYTKLNYKEMVDCSPRFIPECKYFGKDVIYDAPIYLGLDVRKYDTENNFNSLFLTEEDRLSELIGCSKISTPKE